MTEETGRGTSSAALKLAVIIASVREGRFAPVVARWFVQEAKRHKDFEIDVIDLAELDLPLDLRRTSEVTAFADRIAAADAFVIVTCEYNHGYPASVKNALDHLKFEWRAKPVGFVSYGGLAGGLRSVEQLRQVVAELHMVSIRESVSFHMAKRVFDANGEPGDPAAADAVGRMLAQLRWWGQALRQARISEPYPR